MEQLLGQMITDEQILTATNADVLAGTQLDQPGVPGVYTIWAASDVGDSTITITLGGRTIVNGAVITQRANEEIRENEDVFFQLLSRTGGAARHQRGRGDRHDVPCAHQVHPRGPLLTLCRSSRRSS